MAATYTISAIGITMPTAASTRVLNIHNSSVGNANVIRIYRIIILNNFFAAAAPATTQNTTITTSTGTTLQSLIGCYRSTGAPTGGTAITTTFTTGRGITLHDTTSAAPTNLTVMSLATGGSTFDSAAPFFVTCRANDEPAAGALTLDELNTVPVLNTIEFGYGDSNVEPIVLLSGEGIELRTEAVGVWPASCNLDFFVECTYGVS